MFKCSSVQTRPLRSKVRIFKTWLNSLVRYRGIRYTKPFPITDTSPMFPITDVRYRGTHCITDNLAVLWDKFVKIVKCYEINVKLKIYSVQVFIKTLSVRVRRTIQVQSPGSGIHRQSRSMPSRENFTNSFSDSCEEINTLSYNQAIMPIRSDI